MKLQSIFINQTISLNTKNNYLVLWMVIKIMIEHKTIRRIEDILRLLLKDNVYCLYKNFLNTEISV